MGRGLSCDGRVRLGELRFEDRQPLRALVKDVLVGGEHVGDPYASGPDARVWSIPRFSCWSSRAKRVDATPCRELLPTPPDSRGTES